MTQRGSLLIVDDCESNRDVLSRRLAHEGYLVTTAEDGDRALALMGAGAYDLVLLDVEMPGMTGLEVLRRFRETHSQTVLPVIMATGRTEGADIVEAFRLGANDYVTNRSIFPWCSPVSHASVAKRAVEEASESEARTRSPHGRHDGLWDGLSARTSSTGASLKALSGVARGGRSASPLEWSTRVHHYTPDCEIAGGTSR